eukprot:Lankesteria_metandrocarpae@DN5665_c0_g1_i1.p1
MPVILKSVAPITATNPKNEEILAAVGGPVTADENVALRLSAVRTFVKGVQLTASDGFLCVTNQRIIWVSLTGTVLTIDYTSLVLHAVCRDTKSFSEPCIYSQITTHGTPLTLFPEDSTPSAKKDAAALDSTHDEVDDEYEPTVDLRFIPFDDSVLDQLFKVIADMAALHIDPSAEGGLLGDDDDDDDEDDEDDDDDNEGVDLGALEDADV